jgi:hypothetical protein
MNRPGRTRRRLIHLGGLGLTTGLAGCSSLTGRDDEGPDKDLYENRTPPGEDNEPDDRRGDLPEPALSFKTEFSTEPIYRLPRNKGRPDADTIRYSHPDDTQFNITITDESTATATLEQTKVIRDLELRFYVRDTDGDFKSADTKTLEATEDTFETHEFEFDLSNINLPRDAGSICELVAVDLEFDADAEFSIKRHQFVGVAHKNGVNWVNSNALNYSYKIQEDGGPQTGGPRGVEGVNGSKRSTPAGYVETRDGDNERTVFLVTRTSQNGEVFGVSCHIEHEPVNRYKNGSERYQWRYGYKYEAHYATEISHFQELAQKTYDVTSEMDITSPRNRLEVLGDLIQMIPYIRQGDDPMPSVVLYDHYGDCSSKSILMATIIQNDPWNAMGGYIDCEINGIGHWTVGLDVDDLENDFDTDSAFLVAPSEERINDGIPDTEYAFFDMTFDSYIGERTEDVENVKIYDEGDFSNRTSRHVTNDPPNY